MNRHDNDNDNDNDALPSGRVYSCDELCQGRVPRCGGCTVQANGPLRLAPGAVEGYRARFWTSPRLRAVLRFAKVVAWWLCFWVLAGLAAGLISGRGL
jgi:hypothetical protein